MWPFKRRAKVPEKDEAAWSVAQGQYEGSPLFARIRRDPGHPIRGTHNHRVGVAVPLLNPDSRGFPQSDEFSALSEIEDVLSAALESGARSVHVLSITTSGMREFVFYTSNPAWAEDTFRSVQGQVHTHELQLSIEPDPEWSVFRQFSQ